MESAASQAHPSHGHGSQPLAILLLEDSIPDALLLEAHLEEAGLACVLSRVDTRDAFLAALKRGGWDLVLADYAGPAFEGTEALVAARAMRPETPFIFVTGALGEERAIELLKLGATDYVLKDRLRRLVPSMERALREAGDRAERKRVQEALHASERTLKTLMGNMPGMAFRVEPRAPWRFAYASAGARELTGHAPEDLTAGGVSWISLIHPDDRARFVAEVEAAAERQGQLTLRYRIHTRAGEEKWVWDRTVGVAGAGGEIEHLEGFVTDVTQEMRTEEELRQRVRFEQQLIGIVSHDLRGPLNVMLLAAEAALDEEGLDDHLARLLGTIKNAGQRAARMTRDLLDFTQARLGGGIPVDRRDVDLRELVSQVVAEAEATHPGRRVDVGHAGDPRGEWDPDRISQVLSNLVVNALRYSPPGSPVTLRTRGAEDGMIVEVHNLGEPLGEELRTRLFKPMERGTTANRASRSVGLGLYIVDQIVRGHRGRVEVESNALHGTIFRVHLPRTGETPRTTACSRTTAC